MEKQLTCEQRIAESLESRIDDLSAFRDAGFPSEYEDQPNSDEIGVFHEYGLSWDYVEPDTFADQPEGYYRYQLSWGGPSDEFRFYLGGYQPTVFYSFMDWFDGAEVELSGDQRELLLEIWDQFDGLGMCNCHE